MVAAACAARWWVEILRRQRRRLALDFGRGFAGLNRFPQYGTALVCRTNAIFILEYLLSYRKMKSLSQ
jgi:hypothetical protein